MTLEIVTGLIITVLILFIIILVNGAITAWIISKLYRKTEFNVGKGILVQILPSIIMWIILMVSAIIIVAISGFVATKVAILNIM